MGTRCRRPGHPANAECAASREGPGRPPPNRARSRCPVATLPSGETARPWDASRWAERPRRCGSSSRAGSPSCRRCQAGPGVGSSPRALRESRPAGHSFLVAGRLGLRQRSRLCLRQRSRARGPRHPQRERCSAPPRAPLAGSARTRSAASAPGSQGSSGQAPGRTRGVPCGSGRRAPELESPGAKGSALPGSRSSLRAPRSLPAGDSAPKRGEPRQGKRRQARRAPVLKQSEGTRPLAFRLSEPAI